MLYLAKKFEKTESFDILNLVFEISNLKLLKSLKLDARKKKLVFDSWSSVNWILEQVCNFKIKNLFAET